MASATRIDINKVTAADLAETAGIRPHVAGAIVSYRDEHGAFADLASVTEVPGVGATTYQHIRKVVAEIGADETRETDEPVAAKAEPEEAPAETVQVEAEPKAVEAAPEPVEVPEAVKPVIVEPVKKPAPAKAELPAPPAAGSAAGIGEGRQIAALWVDLGKEQMAHNLTTMKAMAGCRSLPEAVNLQQRYIYESYERMTRVMSHYATLAGTCVPKGIRLG